MPSRGLQLDTLDGIEGTAQDLPRANLTHSGFDVLAAALQTHVSLPVAAPDKHMQDTFDGKLDGSVLAAW